MKVITTPKYGLTTLVSGEPSKKTGGVSMDPQDQQAVNHITFDF